MSDFPTVSIPSSWIWCRIQDVATTATGGTPSRSISEYFGGSIPWVKSGELGDGHVFETEETLSELGLKSSNAKLFPKGTLCIALYGATVGKLGILEVDAATNQAVCGIFLPDEVHRDFSFYYLASIRRHLIEQGKGGAQSNISNGLVRETSIPIAPLNEQRRIVAKIEELFSDLDAGVAALKRAKANLKRYRASVLKAAVEGKLTEQWRAKHPAKEPASALLARILKERRLKWEADQLAKFAAAGKEPPKNWRDKYIEPIPPVTTGLPELNDGWSWASVDQICEVGTGTTPSRTNSRFYESGSIPWIMSGAVNLPFVNEASVFVTEFALQETTLRLYPVGTLILALYGEGKTRGMVSELRIEATVNQALGALVFFDAAASIQPFVKVFLTSNYVQLRRQAAGGMQPNLNLGIVKQIAIPLPPIAEQFQIVSEVATKLSQIDAAETQIAHGLLRAARLRQSILKRAFEGKLVPQDPKDESASALLERLRTSRTHDESNGTAATSKRTRAKIKESSGEPRTRIRRRPSSQN